MSQPQDDPKDTETEETQAEIARRALALKKAHPLEPHPETSPTDHGQTSQGDQNLDANQQRSNTIDAHTESMSRSGGVRQSDQG